MQTITNIIRNHGLGSRIISSHQLARMVEGSAQRRYNLVNRALRKGELLQLRRGRYLLVPSNPQERMHHPFLLAQALQPGSFVSFESALGFHGWIPEAVPVTMSVVPGRRRMEVNHPTLGLFRFYPLATREGFFLQSVERLMFNTRPALVAEPLRALMDIICLRKMEPGEMPGMAESMRIDREQLQHAETEEWENVRQIYQHRRMQACIRRLEKEYKA
jgi:predicted transcriptional regulator of viral defense system